MRSHYSAFHKAGGGEKQGRGKVISLGEIHIEG